MYVYDKYIYIIFINEYFIQERADAMDFNVTHDNCYIPKTVVRLPNGDIAIDLELEGVSYHSQVLQILACLQFLWKTSYA